MHLRDAAILDDFRTTRDGYLAVDARIARAGLYHYQEREVGRSGTGMVRVYRPAAEVFDAAAMRSFALRPITMDHPVDPVSSATWKAHAIGTLGEEIRRDGDFLRAVAVIHDGAAIDAIRAGKVELSAGYDAELVWGDGNAPDGTAYQARQTRIRGNHLAVVAKGRAGPACRLAA